VEVIPNGVDTARFSPATVSRDTNRIVVGSVGHLRPVKNHAMLIRACAQLAREGLDLELRIAGGGKDGPSLASLAQSLGFAHRFFLLGQVSDVPHFLRHLDVFVLSSNSEQHPNALNEAMACQMPCIATRVGCVGELLAEGRCGLIIPPGDTDALARALRDLILDPARGRELAVAARQRSCERYSLGRMLGAYEDMYRRLSNGAETPQ
jgi:glycosyltransferase involved in cell wall biosynthesis